MTRLPTIIFTGGGSGGHIYPAMAMAQAVHRFRPDVQCVFVVGEQGLEKEILAREKFKLEVVNTGRLNANVSRIERWMTLVLMPFVLLRCFFVLRKHRPFVVVGTGGAISGPVLLAAKLMGYETVIWEPNVYPGLANRILMGWMKEVLLVFDGAKKYLGGREAKVLGYPLRAEIEGAGGLKSASQKLNVLVFGGSQGARGINNVVSDMILAFPDLLQGINFVHQTGQTDFEIINKKYGGVRGVEVRPYLHDMALRYHLADLVVCRAGTGTLVELAARRLPAILIPLPTAADNHQLKNAEELSRAGAAVLVEQKNLTPDSLRNLILSLVSDPSKRESLSKKIQTFYKPNASVEIAKLLLSKIK